MTVWIDAIPPEPPPSRTESCHLPMGGFSDDKARKSTKSPLKKFYVNGKFCCPIDGCPVVKNVGAQLKRHMKSSHNITDEEIDNMLK